MTAPSFPPKYEIEYTDTAKEEIERTYLWRSTTTSPEAAARWVEGLRARIETLAQFPHRNARAPEFFATDADVRRLLYGNYRVVYLVLEPREPGEQGVARILHVYHGARQATGPNDETNE